MSCVERCIADLNFVPIEKTSNGKNNKAKFKLLRIAGRSQILDQKNKTR